MTSTRRAVLALILCFPALVYAQVRHGTAVVAIRHGNGLVIAADSLEIAPSQTDTSACKIFTSDRSVFSLAGIGGIGADKFSDIFLRDAFFTRPYEEAAFRQAGARWASAVLAILNDHFWAHPQGYSALRKNDRSTVAIFAGITSAGKLILLQERIHYDPARVKKFPYLIADGRIIAIDETLVMGGAGIDTYTEMQAAASSRALGAQTLLHALDQPPTLAMALDTAQSFIATTERWHPGQSGGDIAELAFSPTGTVWTNRPSACR